MDIPLRTNDQILIESIYKYALEKDRSGRFVTGVSTKLEHVNSNWTWTYRDGNMKTSACIIVKDGKMLAKFRGTSEELEKSGMSRIIDSLIYNTNYRNAVGVNGLQSNEARASKPIPGSVYVNVCEHGYMYTDVDTM